MLSQCETLAECCFLNMSLKQLQLWCTNNTVHYRQNDSDVLLNFNEFRQIFGKTPKFLPAPGNLKSMKVARDL